MLTLVVEGRMPLLGNCGDGWMPVLGMVMRRK